MKDTTLHKSMESPYQIFHPINRKQTNKKKKKQKITFTIHTPHVGCRLRGGWGCTGVLIFCTVRWPHGRTAESFGAFDIAHGPNHDLYVRTIT